MSISRHGGYAYTSTKRDASRREFRFVPADELPIPVRSEEHTSELQSLMRISYAVFCLKKKKPLSYTTTQQRLRLQIKHIRTLHKITHKQAMHVKPTTYTQRTINI